MKISEDFTFKRKYFVKDLLNPETLVKGASTLEFASFTDFAEVFLRDRKFSLNNVDKLVVPVENADEAALLLGINPQVRPRLLIYLKDFSKETRACFDIIANTSLLVDGHRVPELKQCMLSDPVPGFAKFMAHSYGYFRGLVNADNVDNIPYIYTDAFFTLPYFCIADIRWDWESFEDMKLKNLHSVVYNTTMVASNMPKKVRSLNLSPFGSDNEIEWEYDYMHTPNTKRLFVKDGSLYIDNAESGLSIDLYDESYQDANTVPLRKLDSIREAFDIKYTPSWGMVEPSLISISQNVKCTGNPAMVPYLCRIVTRTLNGGRV